MMVLPFLSVPLDTGKRLEGADDAGFGGMGPGGSIADKQEKAEALKFQFDRPGQYSALLQISE